MKVVSVTDRGLVRVNNEDCITTFKVGNDYVFVIADGMGGHSGGEIASRIAVDYVTESLKQSLPENDTPEKLISLLKYTIENANVRVYMNSLYNRRYKGMGTTLTIAVLRDWQIYISHVGDCRIYLMHGASLSQLTMDHTLVQELVNSGSITPLEAKNHPKRNVLIKSIGVNEYIEADTYSVCITQGDVIMFRWSIWLC